MSRQQYPISLSNGENYPTLLENTSISFIPAKSAVEDWKKYVLAPDISIIDRIEVSHSSSLNLILSLSPAVGIEWCVVSYRRNSNFLVLLFPCIRSHFVLLMQACMTTLGLNNRIQTSLVSSSPFIIAASPS